jgi:alpha-beta hydrolase superfamily lysophospholipase
MTDAIYFGSGEHRLFGWFHRPTAADRKTFAIVVCKPFGYEAICAHRSIRAFSEAAAGLGIPTLRFDYSGTGDSSEIDPGADQLAIWIRDIVAAAREVQRLSGVQRVYLMGFRLGALLALLAAEQTEALAGLILIAPILNGRRLVREWRTMRLAATIGTEPGQDAGVMEVSGFLLSAATIGALAGIDLKSFRIAASCDVLVIDGATMPIARNWSEDLNHSGIASTYRALPGMVEMLMTAPQFAAVPMEMLAATREWLTQRRPQENAALTDAAYGDSIPTNAGPSITTLALPGANQSELITECPLFLDPASLLFGIVTEPFAGASCKGIVILTNAGADYHIGASGINVLLARRWARSGYVVLRLDLAGLGDSNTRSGRPDNEVFPPAAVDDIRAALQWMQRRYGNHGVSLVGLCSGAFHVMQAAFAALPVERTIMVNPETYFWSEEKSIYDRQTVELVRQRDSQRSGLLSPESWKRLIRGDLDIRYILGTYFGRLTLALESGLRNSARRLRIPLPNDLGSQLEACGARGIRLIFVFARGESGLDLLRLQGGVSIGRLGDRCRIHIVENADHVFSKLASRTTLIEILSGELTAPT